MDWKTCLLLAGSVAACSSDPREIVREAEAVRGECTEERLARSDEECVRMMERAAEAMQRTMGTSIGAVRAFDRALERMPPVQWDTAGLGRALTVDPDTLPGSRRRARNAWPAEDERVFRAREYGQPSWDEPRPGAVSEPWHPRGYGDPYEHGDPRGYGNENEYDREYEYEEDRRGGNLDRGEWTDRERSDYDEFDEREIDPRGLPRHADSDYELTPFQRHQRMQNRRAAEPAPRPATGPGSPP